MWSGCVYLKLVYRLNITRTWRGYAPFPTSHWLGFHSFSSVNLERDVVGLRVLFKKWCQITNKNRTIWLFSIAFRYLRNVQYLCCLNRIDCTLPASSGTLITNNFNNKLTVPCTPLWYRCAPGHTAMFVIVHNRGSAQHDIPADKREGNKNIRLWSGVIQTKCTAMREMRVSHRGFRYKIPLAKDVSGDFYRILERCF